MYESEFKWFELIDRIIEENSNAQSSEHYVNKFLDNFFIIAMDSDDISEENKVKLDCSYQAFKLHNCRRAIVDREADALNGQIVSDYESENPDDYLDIDDMHANEKTRKLILKKKKTTKTAKSVSEM